MNHQPGASSRIAANGFQTKSGEAFLEKVYLELRQLAAARISQESDPQTLQPTALVHEAWLRLDSDNRSWENTGHFFGAAARAMRRILIDRARSRARLKRGGDQTRIDFDSLDLAEATTDERILLINDALEHLAATDPEKAEIVELKFFGGLSNAEVANLLKVTERTVERKWAFAKTWLFSAIEDEFSRSV
jgi:RNA polymerase sigma factor (TIGR02999 family)